MSILISLQSCKDDKDEMSPRVTIESPYEHQNFSAVDTITIFANITDNEQIKSVEVSLVDTEYNSLGVSRTYQVSGSSVSFLTDFILDEPFLNSGLYYLAVRANDGENIGSGYVQIHLTAIPREIENYLVVTKTETQARVYQGDGQSDWEQRGEYFMDLRGAALNFRQNILGLAGGVIGDAVFYETDEFDVVRTIPGYGANSLPYFLGLAYSAEAEQFYLMQRDPFLHILNKNASPISGAQLLNGFLPERVFTVDDNIFVDQKRVTSSARVLGMYAQSGLLLRSYTMTGPVKEVAGKSQTETFLWEDGENGATLFILNSGNNLMETAYNRLGETLYAAMEVDNGSFVISTSTGLYRFDYGSGTTVLNTSIEGLTALYHDELNEIYYGTTGNKLYQISPTGNVIHMRSFTDPIFYFAVNYNR